MTHITGDYFSSLWKGFWLVCLGLAVGVAAVAAVSALPQAHNNEYQDQDEQVFHRRFKTTSSTKREPT